MKFVKTILATTIVASCATGVANAAMADSSPKCNAKPPFLAPQTPPKVV